MLAVGGYGRAEMAPFSDVDLLFVTPYKQTPWGESLIESVLYCLWDLRLKVGQSVRTIDDCLRLARADVTIRTSLLEHRHLWGDERAGRAAARAALERALRADRAGVRRAEARGARRAPHPPGQLALPARAQRQGGQGRPARPADPVLDRQVPQPRRDQRGPGAVGVFTPEEYRIFAEAEAFLWTTRVHLHLLNGRAAEQLTFDTQVEIAAPPRLPPTDGQRAVERFMQDYFTHAKHVGDLTRIFLAALEARHVKPRPSLGEKLRTRLRLRQGRRPARLPPQARPARLRRRGRLRARTRSTSCASSRRRSRPTSRSTPTRCAGWPRTCT